MALKNNWNDLVDGESFVEVEPINRMAHAIIANEENILSVQKLSESIQAENKSQEAEINELSKDLTRFEGDAVRLDSKINENKKRITNLERGIPSDLFLTDSSIAYSKDVPQNALPYAEVRKIGGVTRKCTNLIPSAYRFWASAEVNGITYTANSDGSITVNGTATKTSVVVVSNAIKVKDGTYTVGKISPDTGVFAQLFYKASDGSYPTWNVYNDPVTLDMSAGITYSFQLAVSAGATVSNVKVYPMLNEGSTALPYEPYFEGLRSAPATKVDSVGANLIPFAYEGNSTTKGVVWTTKADGTVNANGTADGGNSAFYLADGLSFLAGNYVLSGAPASAEWGVTVTLYYQDGSGEYVYINAYGGEAKAFTLTKATQCAVYLQVLSGSTVSNVVFKPVLNKGTTAQPYRPYQRHTLPIPEAVRPKHGINEEVYDYIDLDAKQSVKRVGEVVFDGSSDENWVVRQYTNLVAFLESEKFGKIPNRVLCDRFESFIDMSARPNGTVGIAVEGLSATAHTFFFGVSGIATNVAEWRAYLAANPITVYYELATLEITDISDLVSEDNFIGVEGNGTITMANQYKYNVPSEIVFMLNEV